MAESLYDKMDRIRWAFDELQDWTYIWDILDDDSVIVRTKDGWYKAPFSYSDGEILFADRSVWMKVEPESDWVAAAKDRDAKVRPDAGKYSIKVATLPVDAETNLSDTAKSVDVVDDKRLVKMIADDRVGGYLVLWGDSDRKDLQGDYFTPETQGLTDIFKAVNALPLFWQHAADDTLKYEVVGVIDSMKSDDVGLWVEAQMRMSDKYQEYITKIKEMVGQKRLGMSSGRVVSSFKRADDGKIEVWPIYEGSLTPTPAESRMLEHPVQELGAAYKAIGVELPETITLSVDSEEEGRVKAINIGLGRLKLIELESRDI